MNESEQLRTSYETIVKQNPSSIEAVSYLAQWHLQRHSYNQARKYFGHLATLQEDCSVFLSISICCSMTDEFTESLACLKRASLLRTCNTDEIRIRFCTCLMSEKRKEYSAALDGYEVCLNEVKALYDTSIVDAFPDANMTDVKKQMSDFRGDILLRIALTHKETGHVDEAMALSTSISEEDSFGDSLRANALCLKGLLHEIKAEFPASEVVYRSALQLLPGHGTALERLGRVYLRYRETIPAAVQCFFKSVESNPSNHLAWYLLGRCYMATDQYSDAYEAYNRAINLNPNDPQVWCSLGVLYYAFGQYRESLGMFARALKLEPSMADAWYNVGALYDMVDQPEDAQLAYMKARENGLADRFARAGVGNAVATRTSGGINIPASSSGINRSNSSSSDSHHPPSTTLSVNAGPAATVSIQSNAALQSSNASTGTIGSTARVRECVGAQHVTFELNVLHSEDDEDENDDDGDESG